MRASDEGDREVTKMQLMVAAAFLVAGIACAWAILPAWAAILTSIGLGGILFVVVALFFAVSAPPTPHR